MFFCDKLSEALNLEVFMARVAIMTDSNSGITQAQAKEIGVFVMPMPFIINEETFFEDKNLTREEFYQKMAANDDISTTQPAPGDVMDMWSEILKEYDEIVYIPMSSGLSGSCSTATMLATEDDFDGKVFVVDNQRISVTMRRSVLDAMELAKEGKSAEEIKNYLVDTKKDSSIYIMLDTLKYLKKGGRITPAAAALGTILKLKPVLQIQGEKLDAFAKARTIGQAKSTMINVAKSDIENRYGNDMSKVWIDIAHTENLEEALKFKAEILEAFPGYPEENIYIDHLSLSVSCHIGPGSLAIAVTKMK